MPDPAEPGGRSWMAGPGPRCWREPGIQRVSYFLKASSTFSKACLMLPLAWSPRPSAWSASLPVTFPGAFLDLARGLFGGVLGLLALHPVYV
jgi:hypothetical protein